MLTIQLGFTACVCVYLVIAETLLIETLRYLRCEHEQESVNEPLTDHSAHFLGWPTPSRVSKILCWIAMMMGGAGERGVVVKNLQKCQINMF